MARRTKRQTTVFSLSFLDIMSCGFGAVILFFVIIDHETETRQDNMTADLNGEVMMLDTEVKLEELNKVQLRNSLEEIEQALAEAEGRSERLIDEVETEREELSAQEEEALARREHFNRLVADIKRLEDEINKAESNADESGDDQRPFYGEGDRQYLTGLRVGGDHVLILLDASASMLDSSIVNILRRRNLPDDQKVRSEKWQRALLTVDWLTTQIPENTKFQIIVFNVDAESLFPGTEGEWLDIGEGGRRLTEASAKLREVIPQGGTRLHAPFAELNGMSPLPDNVYLITDSLPTQGARIATQRDNVTARQRERFFDDAISQLPVGVPMNIITFPMEGDPSAPSLLWKLAMATSGSFLAPSEDWP